MPIRLNLLAEAQAAEEMRRRDPVKRAIWLGALLSALMLVWSASLQFKAISAKNELERAEAKANALTNDFRQVTESQKSIADINHRLSSLQQLTTNRHLTGNLLDALQRATLDDIQLTHLRLANEYRPVEETKASTNGNRIIPGKPATITEKITLTLECVDNSAETGPLVDKYRDLLATHPYFKDGFEKPVEITLKNYSSPQLSPETGRSCVLFTLEARFPEKTR